MVAAAKLQAAAFARGGIDRDPGAQSAHRIEQTAPVIAVAMPVECAVSGIFAVEIGSPQHDRRAEPGVNAREQERMPTEIEHHGRVEMARLIRRVRRTARFGEEPIERPPIVVHDALLDHAKRRRERSGIHTAAFRGRKRETRRGGARLGPDMETTTMKAVRVPSADAARLELATLDIPAVRPGTVRVRVGACGICHSDAFTVHNAWPGIDFPRVPGHEIAGTIDAVGEGVSGWKVGDRVGVGWHGGHCGVCDRCRRGDFLTCRALQVPGMAYDGGYAEYVVVPAVALARVPDALTDAEAAPLMCAGVTTYNALRHSPAHPGDVVAILGVGGLGHLGVQFAAKMGFETVAIARGAEKAAFAKELGAHHYLDSRTHDVAAELQKLGGAKVVLATVTAADAMLPVLGGLGFDGQLLIVGASMEPLAVPTAPMIGGRHSIKAWPSGTNVDSEETMRFAVLHGVRAMIETMPLERASEAYDRMMSGAARFRMVLTR